MSTDLKSTGESKTPSDTPVQTIAQRNHQVRLDIARDDRITVYIFWNHWFTVQYVLPTSDTYPEVNSLDCNISCFLNFPYSSLSFVQLFDELKIRRKHRYLIFKLEDITVEGNGFSCFMIFCFSLVWNYLFCNHRISIFQRLK